MSQRVYAGDVLELSINDEYYYAIQLENNVTRFIDYRSNSPLIDLTVLSTEDSIFDIVVYRDVLSSGVWKKVGKLPIPYNVPEFFYIHHSYETNSPWELYVIKTGEIVLSDRDTCFGLEMCAVWDRNHVEDRIRSHYEGKPCVWLKEHYRNFSKDK